MSFTHKIFLIWLLYAVVVLFGWSSMFYLGLPQIAIHYDHSYLTYVLFGLYLLAEILSGCQAWKISNENKIADDVIEWFSKNKLTETTMKPDGGINLIAISGPDRNVELHEVPSSIIADHFRLLSIKANAGQKRIRQDTIIDVTADSIYEKNMTAEFLASRIVWIGILATILGVIMAFWPMIDGVSIDSMKSNLGAFFGGIAVAFIPTAVSFVFKIVLDFNAKIVGDGVRDLINKVAIVAETSLLPIIDSEDVDATLS